MTITAKQLADGQLPAAAGDLYTVPASTTAYVKSIVLVNTGAGDNDVNLLILPAAGVARQITPVDLTMVSGDAYFDATPYVLDAGDKLRGDADNPNEVDYVISGAEES
jgi:hypothetical protein